MDKKRAIWMAAAVPAVAVLFFLWMGNPVDTPADPPDEAMPDPLVVALADTSADPPTDAPTWRPAELFPATQAYKGPDFELENITGESIRLSDFDGRIVVLNLWATWCPPCRDEVPALVRLQEEFGDRSIQVIGVSLDENGARSKVAEFAESFGVNFPTPVDDGRVQEKYGPLSVIPTTYFLDRERNIRFYAPGYLEYGQMEEAVRELLND
jgi:peroxiredoxin